MDCNSFILLLITITLLSYNTKNDTADKPRKINYYLFFRYSKRFICLNFHRIPRYLIWLKKSICTAIVNTDENLGQLIKQFLT